MLQVAEKTVYTLAQKSRLRAFNVDHSVTRSKRLGRRGLLEFQNKVGAI